MIKCLVFDLDGVVINSHELQIKALKESYRKAVGEGDPPYEIFFKNSGNSLPNIIKKLRLPMEIIPYYLEVSTEHMEMIKIHDGMERMLLEYTEKGYQCAVCTGKDRKRTLAILAYLKLDSYFKAVVCSDDVNQPKPSPESLLKAVEILNGDIKSTVMIGDGINDILCAKSAYITSIGVLWGDLSREDIVRSQPDYIVNTVEELRSRVNDKFRE